MQQFYYLAVLFVAGGVGSALIVAADLRTRRQPMRIMESVWVLTALWASFFGLWAYYAFGRATRHMPVQNDGTGKQKGLVKISDGKAAHRGKRNERKVGSAGQETENQKARHGPTERPVRSGDGSMEGLGAGTSHEHAGTGDDRDADGERNHDRSGRCGRYARDEGDGGQNGYGRQGGHTGNDKQGGYAGDG